MSKLSLIRNKQKLLSLLLLSLLKTKRVKSGQAFNNCLTDQNGEFNNLYNNLLNLSFNINSHTNNSIIICCDNHLCFQSLTFPLDINTVLQHTPQHLCPSDRDYKYLFSCVKLEEGIICVSTNEDSGIVCGGILGNTTVTTNTNLGNCANLNTAADYFSTIPAIDLGISKGYAS